jgi:purine-nucleoside phosphorylase
MSALQNQLSDAVSVIRDVIGSRKPDLLKEQRKAVGLILGSGLGLIAEAVENRVVIPYGDIPGFHVSKVEGHAGQFIVGDIGNSNVMIMQGRFHYYEGASMDEIAFPIDLMKELGVGSVIITSASGGANPELQKGNIMILDDHINYVFRNPLRGRYHLMGGAHIPRVNDIYDNDLKKLAFDIAKAENIDLKRGVYLMVAGPSYETVAEVKMVRKLGGDVVGMSTVPEAIAANHNDMSVLGITYVSNMASGLAPGPLVHSHVIETMEMIRDDMLKLITGIIKKI